MTLTRLHHVAVVVADADAALGFWRDTLGLTLAKDRVVQDQGVRGVLLALRNAEIELIQPVTPDSGVARFLETRGEGLHHICFESTDVAADLVGAKTAGIEMIDETPRPGLAGMIGFLHPRANHGVLVEYAQPPADEPARPANPDPATPQSLHHVVCATHDLDGTAGAFGRHFGLVPQGDHESPAFGLAGRWLGLPDQPADPDSASARIELVCPLGAGPDHPLTQRLEHGEGLFRVVCQVPQLAACVERLARAGLATDDMLGDGSVIEVQPRGANGVRLVLAAG